MIFYDMLVYLNDNFIGIEVLWQLLPSLEAGNMLRALSRQCSNSRLDSKHQIRRIRTT